MKPKTSGGAKYKRLPRQSNQNWAAGQPVILVGFLDKRINVLALQLEFGNPKTGLPERPAYRQGVEDLKRHLPAIVARVVKSSRPARDGLWKLTHTQAVEIGHAARDILRQSYEGFTGVGLSERQERRARRGRRARTGSSSATKGRS